MKKYQNFIMLMIKIVIVILTKKPDKIDFLHMIVGGEKNERY